ncbi:hypothetical protein WOLCODRAFT_142889 [Wolfiporia cocos MD-104 SS10]|uniref:Ricin B lectin domain-containing protein n=1 Tax=Wolfiporia cocos (strain MD-104) TaxID=742152 RepID=A0A2H3JDU1_WOLCO|nr:hypothetical protein WOLCODRAFT_142889 [Wolfiporia cocos MD-104 SS10]
MSPAQNSSILPSAGIYYIINLHSKTALEVIDTPEGDLRVETASLYKKSSQQYIDDQWKLIPAGRGYIIQSMKSSSNGLLYMTMQTVGDNEKVIVTPYLTVWDIQHDTSTDYPDIVRFHWPTTKYVLQTVEKPSPEREVLVRGFVPSRWRQKWRLTRCETLPVANSPAHAEILEAGTSKQSVSQPTVSETVLVTEDANFITTTRTKMTVMTVTTITKRPCLWPGSDTASGATTETPIGD